MTDPQGQFEQFIEHLGAISGQDFPINNNACSLINGQDEVAAVIELPEGSDLLVIHSMVARLPADPAVQQARALQLLTLNSCPEKLRGAWFSIADEGYGIYLMTSSPIGNLTTVSFEHLLFNYLELADNLKLELAEEELELIPRPPVVGLQV